MIERLIAQKIEHFPKITVKDSPKLWELADLLSEIEAAKRDPHMRSLYSFDTASGIRAVVEKLPYNIQEKWINHASTYKKRHRVTFPPFEVFVEFIHSVADTKNDPSFMYSSNTVVSNENRCAPSNYTKRNQHVVSVRKTDLPDSAKTMCPIHKTNHSLKDCKGFRAKPIMERRQILKEKRMCFRCCETNEHVARDCKVNIRCGLCNSYTHPSALHVECALPPRHHGGEQRYVYGPERPPMVPLRPPAAPPQVQNAEHHPPGPPHMNTPNQVPVSTPSIVTSNCIEVCSDQQLCGKSCAKIVPVNVYSKNNPHEIVQIYAILDDQSNRYLASQEFFDKFDIQSATAPYSLQTCSGTVDAGGRRATDYIVESVDGSTCIEMPTIIECDKIPNNRSEIPTSDAARSHAHLRSIADSIPEINNDAAILLLIGRDVPEAHHGMDQCLGPRNSPFAQRLPLGWVLIGETCLGKMHAAESVNVYRTNVMDNGRPSLFTKCPSFVSVRETNVRNDHMHMSQNKLCSDFGASVFERTQDDEKTGLSVEDRVFLDIMDSEFTRGPTGNWVAPLPFRDNKCQLPNNRSQAVKRARTLDKDLKKNDEKRNHFVTFMKTIIESGHAELAPPLNQNESWYLPIFGVYHPRKPQQIRGVFDSSAKHYGISLNDVLLSGPDMTNSLLGILLRFRKDRVAVTADIQQMFHCFLVREDHKDFLRFLWYRDNNPNNELVDYRMRVDVFGNSPSPAVATYGLRRIAKNSAAKYGSDVCDFVHRNFYVDDGLASLPTSTQAIDLMKRTQEALQLEGNLRLHKIASNSDDVMKAFPSKDLAKNLIDLDLNNDNLPLQRSLGLTWDLSSDTFTYHVATEPKPYTRRGVLSTVNSLFDPIGFLCPVIIKGKLILRECMSDITDWDQPLPTDQRTKWISWRDSLRHLKNTQIPRMFVTTSLSLSVRNELHVFSDASEDAIAAVAYIRTVSPENDVDVGFVMGKAKVAPKHGHTIPRLELCAAVLATEIYEFIVDNLDTNIDSTEFYTDSKVVLGYIHNQRRRFYTYVSNRVERIRRYTEPSQWS